MEKIKFFLFYIAAIITVFSCKKDRYQQPAPPGVAQLLTAKPWKLLSYGYDNNNNGRVDSQEEAIRDCEKDNVSVFTVDGSGVVNENAAICDGYEKESRFTWSLTNNDSVIDFNYGIAFIDSISKDRLIITQTISEPVKLLIIYGH
jgi:hypothetical protein